MKSEHERFLNLRRLPGVIDAEEVAALLGVTPANIPILVSKSFLKPLGVKLAPNAPRRFSSALVEKLARDPDEMGRMHQLISQHWRFRNGTKTPKLKSVSKAA